jgi:ribosomal protein S24E
VLGNRLLQFRDVTNVCQWAEEKLTTEEINNKLLLGTDKEGMSARHLAAEWGNSETLQQLWEWAKEK